MTVLGAIGDISRFPTPKHLVSYAGLAGGLHHSGQTYRTKGITKRGRRGLRRVLIEAAWMAVRTSPYWKAQFRRLTRHKPSQVAIARKLLVAVWYVLSKRAADCHAEPRTVACKLMRWSWQLTKEQRGGLTSRQFIRYTLLRLQLGHDLTTLTYGGTPHGLASVEEIPALFPELADPA